MAIEGKKVSSTIDHQRTLRMSRVPHSGLGDGKVSNSSGYAGAGARRVAFAGHVSGTSGLFASLLPIPINSGSVEIHPNGQLKSVTLQTDFRDGRTGVQFKGKTTLEFFPNGRPMKGVVKTDSTIKGIPVAGDSEIEFDSNGRLRKAVASKPFSRGGVNFQKGEDVVIDENGRFIKKPEPVKKTEPVKTPAPPDVGPCDPLPESVISRYFDARWDEGQKTNSTDRFAEYGRRNFERFKRLVLLYSRLRRVYYKHELGFCGIRGMLIYKDRDITTADKVDDIKCPVSRKDSDDTNLAYIYLSREVRLEGGKYPIYNGVEYQIQFGIRACALFNKDGSRYDFRQEIDVMFQLLSRNRSVIRLPEEDYRPEGTQQRNDQQPSQTGGDNSVPKKQEAPPQKQPPKNPYKPRSPYGVTVIR